MPSDRRVTGTMLRDVVQCERRAWHDVHTDPGGRDRVSSFVQLLWAGGTAHESKVLSMLDGSVTDLRDTPAGRRFDATVAALASGATHILGAELARRPIGPPGSHLSD